MGRYKRVSVSWQVNTLKMCLLMILLPFSGFRNWKQNTLIHVKQVKLIARSCGNVYSRFLYCAKVLFFSRSVSSLANHETHCVRGCITPNGLCWGLLPVFSKLKTYHNALGHVLFVQPSTRFNNDYIGGRRYWHSMHAVGISSRSALTYLLSEHLKNIALW